MEQKIIFSQTFKQTFKLNQTMINSLDFLKLDNYELSKIISEFLQTNPFVELKNIDKNRQELENNYIENISNPLSLVDELNKQLITVPLPFEKNIMDYLINSLDNHGFLSYNENDYLSSLGIDKKYFYFHLHILQSLEPSGVGAFDIFDSICIQLRKQKKHKSYKLLREYKDYILSYNYQNILKHTPLTKKELDTIYDDIRTCNLYPCSKYTNNNDSYIQPDIEIKIENGKIIIVPINQPTIILNNNLYKLVKESPKMNEYFKSATFLLENLNKRNQSVLFISDKLIQLQKGYFLYNDELVPCNLNDLANLTGYHESTISRTLNNKYYMFNGEIYPLKNLLISKTLSGDSSDAIKKAIVELINMEDKKHPLSDEKLVEELENIGLSCSRRVINKYRKQLNIPSSFKRKSK